MCKGWSSYLLLLAAVVLLGLAAYHYGDLWQGSPRFAIDQPEKDLTRIASGTEHVIHFTMSNPTRSPVRVVGMREC